MNKIYKADNLEKMKQMKDGSVDLIVTDPPFYSKRDYKDFADTWSTLDEYLEFMNLRFIEMHRLLKSNGTLLLHCDSNSSHYLKVNLDKIFKISNFRNEIIWVRHLGAKNVTRNLANNFDTIFRYTKGNKFTFNQEAITLNHSEEHIKKYYKYTEPETGRRYATGNLHDPYFQESDPKKTFEFCGVYKTWNRDKEQLEQMLQEGRIVHNPGSIPRYKLYLDEAKGNILGNVWDDIPNRGTSKQNEHYSTQKPLNLYIRLVGLCSNPGDLVLDPFCGSGTTLEAAKQLQRKYIGIDLNKEGISIARKRLNNLL